MSVGGRKFGACAAPCSQTPPTAATVHLSDLPKLLVARLPSGPFVPHGVCSCIGRPTWVVTKFSKTQLDRHNGSTSAYQLEHFESKSFRRALSTRETLDFDKYSELSLWRFPGRSHTV